jgi:3-hydroxyisobutyrate dehydrogenase-like beta-hydroxyacid dehydrogenase
MSARTPSILFVGIGKMGRPMARRLHDAGFALAIADVTPAALSAFERDVPHGTTPGALDGELVITMLPTDRHVADALFGAGGALERPRRAVIDMSSSAPAGSRRIAERLRERGVAFLDAPVSGGVGGAQRGSLTAMIGGEAALLDTYRPVLEAMCKTLVHVGPTAAGVTIKALNNFLAAVGLWATSEALVVGAKAGLDPQTMIDVWSTSSGKNDAVLTKAPAAILPRSFDYGFSVGLMAKDLGIAAGIARDVDVAAPLLAEHAATWALAREALGFDRDMTAIVTLIESWCGYEVPAVAREKGPA